MINRIPPAPGQESVWDYPRPPRLEDSSRQVQIIFNNVVIAETRQAKRLLETSHPPSYYIPPTEIRLEYFSRTPRSSFCEWKGQAAYYSIQVGEQRAENAAWFYPEPTPAFSDLANYVAFYPSLMQACYLDGEQVQAQPGDFYGGWITSEIVGPFKGGLGSWGW
ncbi:MAG: DUF427 domain-containing protein [Pegethrix bostrychoides GSE-TBD4-15B]|jgi:uncharacterized protein (DUF427 family)|uniref:DUF427 domain-containing protein n=1 Tax=Pegethrix bostrychoides GSE-TBD4-15B TaxID=2839662 RepID=A0A951P7X9_9CYAN|nr:DUF427 domain-containing protein [Pegethrix bostrychoides GSE-TBD4-15B]